jgi:hypothetical protein
VLDRPREGGTILPDTEESEEVTMSKNYITKIDGEICFKSKNIPTIMDLKLKRFDVEHANEIVCLTPEGRLFYLKNRHGVIGFLDE